MKYNYKIFFIYLTIFFICILSSCVPKEQGLVKNQNITEKQENVKCYVDVQSSKNFNHDLILSMSISLISDFVQKVHQDPPEGISLKNSCIYYVNAQKEEETTIVTISGEGINSYGDSKLDGMDGFQKSLLKSLYRSVENKVKLCSKYGKYLEECYEDNIKLTDTGGRIRLQNVLGRKQIPKNLIKEKRPLEKGIYVSVGGNKFNYSYDGKNWISRKFSKRETYPYYRIESITYGNGFFLAVGVSCDESYSCDGCILISTNGEKWEDTKFKSRNKLTSVSYAKGIYFVIGEKDLLVSEDGFNWQNIESPEIFGGYGNEFILIDKIKLLNGKIFAIGDYGKLLTINDDLTLNSHNVVSDSFAFVWDFEFGNGKYVILGSTFKGDGTYSSGGAYSVSDDGSNWNHGIFREEIYGIKFGRGIFVVVGNHGYIFLSEDGEKWQPANYLVKETLNDVTYGNNLFVTVGKTTLFSEDGVNWEEVDCRCGKNNSRKCKCEGNSILFRSNEHFSGVVQKIQNGVLFKRYVNRKYGWYEKDGANNRGRYEGEIENLKPNGQGTFTTNTGNKYLGEWKDGKEWNITWYDKDGYILGKFVNGEIN